MRQGVNREKITYRRESSTQGGITSHLGQNTMPSPTTIIILLLIIHILQNDARLWQVTKELRKMRKERTQPL